MVKDCAVSWHLRMHSSLAFRYSGDLAGIPPRFCHSTSDHAVYSQSARLIRICCYNSPSSHLQLCFLADLQVSDARCRCTKIPSRSTYRMSDSYVVLHTRRLSFQLESRALHPKTCFLDCVEVPGEQLLRQLCRQLAEEEVE